MRDKGQVVTHLRNFLATVNAQYGKHMKVVRLDNGAEFLSTSCQALFND